MEFKKVTDVEWIPFAVVKMVMKEMIRTHNFKTEDIGTVSSIVRLVTLLCHRTELMIWI